MTRAPTYPIHRNRRNSISIRFSVRSIRFSRCGLRALRPSPSRLARARRQGDTLPPWRARVKGELALHRASTTRGGGGVMGRARATTPPDKKKAPGRGQRAPSQGARDKVGPHGAPRQGGTSARWTTNEALEREKGKLGPHGAPSWGSALAWSGESEACCLSI